MNDIKIAVTKFEKYIAGTPDHIFYGILKREFIHSKKTIEEWKSTVQQLKSRPVNSVLKF